LCSGEAQIPLWSHFGHMFSNGLFSARSSAASNSDPNAVTNFSSAFGIACA